MSKQIKSVEHDEYRMELQARWIKACADIIEYDKVASSAAATSGPNETTVLTMFTALIPAEYTTHYMDGMVRAHNELSIAYEELVPDRPEKPH